MPRLNGDLDHKYLLFLPLFLFFAAVMFAADNFGTNTAEFLQISPESGPTGMGEAYMGIADGSSALVYNPAGLASLDRTEFAANEILWFNNINMTHAAFAHPLDAGTGFGFDVLWIDFGSFDSTGGQASPVSVQNALVNAGFGKSLGDIIDVGINAKGLYENFIDQTSFGLSLDAGALIKTASRNITMGITIKNIGFVSGTSDSLPMEAGAGVALRLFSGSRNYFNFDIDASKVITTDNIFFNAGVEGTLYDVLTLRFGFRFNNALDLSGNSFSSLQDLMLFSGGAGIRIGDYSVDYSYTPMGDLGTIQRIGLTMRFGGSAYEKNLAGQKAVVEPKTFEAPVVDVEAGQIRSVSFKPNVPQENVKEWSLNIKTPDGKIVKTFSGIGEVPKNLTWDGTDSFGKIAKADANYVFDFNTKDNAGQVMKSGGQLIQPKKYEYMQEEDKRFIPVKGREMLVAPVTMLVSSSSEERRLVPFVMVNDRIKDIRGWEFDVYDRNNTPLKKFKGVGILPSYLVWDGKDYDGNLVNDLKSCRYVLTVTGADGKKAEIKDRRVMRNPFVIASRSEQIKMAERIFFETDSTDLNPDMESRLNEIGGEISKYPRTQVYIQGHSSTEGDRAHNVSLSQQRAKTVLRYLVEKFKISPISITTVGYGSDIPVDSNDNEETRAKSRRVEVIIIGETE